MIDTTASNIMCAHTLINCKERDNAGIFIDHNSEITNPPDVRLEYGQHKETGVIAVSKNEKYKLILQYDGSLAILLHDKIVWENGMDFFEDYYARVRINEKGHLVEEVKSLFVNTTPEYRSDEWITVWSSAPINHNVTIGIPSYNDKNYVLVVSDTGFLHMYDSVGTLTWCTALDCKHRVGYKFPEVYLVPTNMITPQDNDKHNNIDKNVKIDTDSDFLMSLDFKNKCSFLKSDTGIVSKNGRFKLILEESGNLIIKDQYRTMWESASGFMSFATNPYKLILTPMGNLVILSANNYMVWTSNVKSQADSSRPYMAQILDEGRLIVTDRQGSLIWESWPMNGMSLGVTLFSPIEYRFVPCSGNNLASRRRLVSRFKNDQLNHTEKLISSNGIWDLAILNKSRLVLRELNVVKNTLVDLDDSVINQLLLKDDGTVLVKNVENETVLSLYSRQDWKMQNIKVIN